MLRIREYRFSPTHIIGFTIFAILLTIVLLIVCTKLVYPFYYGSISRSEFFLNNPQFTPKILLFSTFSLLFLLSFCYVLLISKASSRLHLILIFSSLLFITRSLGAYSQNIFYHNDDVVHVGIIENIKQGTFDGNSWDGRIETEYVYLFLHKTLAFISSTTFISSHDTILYLYPLILSVLQIPLIIKFVDIFKNKCTLSFVTVLTFAFPFAGRLWFGLTPYILLVLIFSSIIALYPYNKLWKFPFIVFLLFFAFGSHSHGILLIPFTILLISFSIFKSKVFNFGILVSSLIVTFSFFFVIIELNNMSYFLYNFVEYQRVVRIFVMNFGEWDFTLHSKIAQGGIGGFWYLMQIITLIIIAFCSFFNIVYITFNRHFSLSVLENNFFYSLSLLSIYLLSISLWSLFRSYGTQLFRIYYFIIIIGITVSFFTLRIIYSYIKKIRLKEKIFTASIRNHNYFTKFEKIFPSCKSILKFSLVLGLILLSQITVYFSYVPYSTRDYEAIYWVQDEVLTQNNNTNILASLDMAKLIYCLTYFQISTSWLGYWDIHKNNYNVTELISSTILFNRYAGKFHDYLIVRDIDIVLEYQTYAINITMIIDAWIEASIISLVYENSEVKIYEYINKY